MASLSRLHDIMRILRSPGGCPWDRAQDFASIAPYTVEEAYEVTDAIAREDMVALRDELGDLLLQVVFHAAIAADREAFDLDDVVAGICAKMERRHPHVFGTGEVTDWETIKAGERAAVGPAGALAGVARALPALMRAEKLQKRAARTGFDWPDAAGPRAKIDEEIAEVAAATNHADRHAEIGDLLFSVVNWARHLDVDPEASLRDANDKFARRFAAMEHMDPDFAKRTPAEKEAYWIKAKAAEIPRP